MTKLTECLKLRPTKWEIKNGPSFVRLDAIVVSGKTTDINTSSTHYLIPAPVADAADAVIAAAWAVDNDKTFAAGKLAAALVKLKAVKDAK